MDDRFEVLYKLEGNLYKPNAPIIIPVGLLLRDKKTGSVIAQFKFQNVSNYEIIGLKISLSAYDMAGERLKGVEEYQYLDINVQSGEFFGANKAIVLPEKVTRSISIDKIMVVFANAMNWEINGKELATLPKQEFLVDVLGNLDLVEQYHIDSMSNGDYVPLEINGLWLCSCGSANINTRCVECNGEKDKVFGAWNVDTLTLNYNNRLENDRNLQEKRKLEEFEVVRKEEEVKERKRVEEEAKRRRTEEQCNKIFIISKKVLKIAIASILFLLIFLIVLSVIIWMTLVDLSKVDNIKSAELHNMTYSISADWEELEITGTDADDFKLYGWQKNGAIVALIEVWYSGESDYATPESIGYSSLETLDGIDDIIPGHKNICYAVVAEDSVYIVTIYYDNVEVKNEDALLDFMIDSFDVDSYENPEKELEDKEYEDSSDDLNKENTSQKDTGTIENITHIAALLGREIDKDESLNLSDDDYNFVTNDVKLFGANGCVEASTSEVGDKLHKIDIIDWTSNVGIEDLDTLIEVLEDYYGTEYVIDDYMEYSDSACMWKDVDEFSYVICWENSNGTVTIRWMINLEAEE